MCYSNPRGLMGYYLVKTNLPSGLISPGVQSVRPFSGGLGRPASVQGAVSVQEPRKGVERRVLRTVVS